MPDNTVATIQLEPANGTDTKSAPPAYTETAASGGPPSYDAIYGKLQALRDQSTGNVDYGRRVANHFFCSTVCAFIWSFVLMAVPIAMIVIGVRGLNDCPIQRLIPIYLIVAGAFGILKSLANLGEWVYHRVRHTDEEEKKPANPFDGLINLFLFCWFIAGSYWVYSIHKTYQSSFPSQPFYCERTTYLFAFWAITVQYIFMALGILICFSCCFCLCFCGCCKKKDEENN